MSTSKRKESTPFTREEMLLAEKEKRIHVISFYDYGGSKEVSVSNWYLVDRQQRTSDGGWVRVIMSPAGWLYRDYWSDGGKHELQVLYRPPYPKKKRKGFHKDKNIVENDID